MLKRCLDDSRCVLDRFEEADWIRDLDAHRLQHGSGVRLAQLTAHALKSTGAENELVAFWRNRQQV
jgi:hypothetical protein